MSTPRSIWLGPLAALAITTMSCLPATAREADLASHTVAAAPTAKKQCINACRARYRDCRHLNQLPSFECRGVLPGLHAVQMYWLRTGLTDVPFAVRQRLKSEKYAAL
jgi:hypothetical protein